MNFLYRRPLVPTGQRCRYIRNALLRYCIKFIEGETPENIAVYIAAAFFFSSFHPIPPSLAPAPPLALPLLSTFFIVIITLESKLALAKIAL